MASGKRASMREGPLAALFRKTEEDAARAEGAGEADSDAPQLSAPIATPADEIPPREFPHPSLAVRDEPEPRVEPRIPTPQDRLRHAFSSELEFPEDLMEAPE